MRTSDVVIAGAGIIGLSAALELALHGFSVSVFEQGLAMREASWAAAGMLAAHDPENPPELRALAELSLQHYPAFLAGIERLSGLPVPLRTSRTLQAFHPNSPGEAQGLQALSCGALCAHVRGIQPGGRAFALLREHSLDPRDLCRALPLAALAAGVELHQETAVLRVEQSASNVRIHTTRGEFAARHLIQCCGAWPVLEAAHLPIQPRKGQMLAVTLPPEGPSLDCVIRTPELYLVPRGDGRVIIGATVEQAGFDRTVTHTAMDALFEAAAELWPAVRQGVVTERWAGLRPAAPDGLPILGFAGGEPPQVPGGRGPAILVATGHFRNGILLAPATARVLRHLLLGDPIEVGLRPFRLERFAAVESAS